MARRPNSKLEQFWRNTIGQWQRSGLSVCDICSERQLGQANFYAWRRELAKRDRTLQRDRASQPPLKFVPVQLRADALLEIALPDGLVVRVPPAVEPAAVAALVKALRASPC